MQLQLGGDAAKLAQSNKVRAEAADKKRKACQEYVKALDERLRNYDYICDLLRRGKDEKYKIRHVMTNIKVPFNVRHPARWSE
jgi:hypothetical protein